MNEKVKAIVDKIRAGAYAAGEFATKTYNTAGKKATGVYNASKIKLKIFDLTTDVDVLYREVGKLLYASHCNEETSAEEIDARLTAIDEKISEIEELREALKDMSGTKKCSACGKTHDGDCEYCSQCGEKLDD